MAIWLFWFILGPWRRRPPPRIPARDSLETTFSMPARSPRSFIYPCRPRSSPRRGVISGHKLGRRWIFLRDEIEAGVRRAAPTKPASPSTSQRPASKAGKSTSGYQKRYPMAVPIANQALSRVFRLSRLCDLQAVPSISTFGAQPVADIGGCWG